jgi:hypothetical protein
MLEEARGTEMSMLYGVTALGEQYQQRGIHSRFKTLCFRTFPLH